ALSTTNTKSINRFYETRPARSLRTVCLWCANALGKGIFEPLGGALLKLRDDVRIHVQSHPGGAVPEPLADRLDVFAEQHQDRRVRVPQLVAREAREPGTLQNLAEVLCGHPLVKGLACPVGEDEAVIFVTPSGLQSLLGLRPLVLLQRPDEYRRQRDAAAALLRLRLLFQEPALGLLPEPDRPLNRDGAGVEVEVIPPERRVFTGPRAREQRELNHRAHRVFLRGLEQVARLFGRQDSDAPALQPRQVNQVRRVALDQVPPDRLLQGGLQDGHRVLNAARAEALLLERVNHVLKLGAAQPREAQVSDLRDQPLVHDMGVAPVCGFFHARPDHLLHPVFQERLDRHLRGADEGAEVNVSEYAVEVRLRVLLRAVNQLVMVAPLAGRRVAAEEDADHRLAVTALDDLSRASAHSPSFSGAGVPVPPGL